MEQILDLLRLFYSNPDEIGEAKDKLAALTMKDSDEFYVFCANFVKLASLAGTPLTEWKYELNRRLTLPLRQLILTKYLNKAIGFEIFRFACSKTVTVGGHRRYRRSYNSLFSTVLTGLPVTLLTGRSSKSYIFSSGGDSEDIVSLWVHIGPPGPPTAGARGLSTSCP
jgi:hypothetical protein